MTNPLEVLKVTQLHDMTSTRKQLVPVLYNICFLWKMLVLKCYVFTFSVSATVSLATGGEFMTQLETLTGTTCTSATDIASAKSAPDCLL